MRLNQNTGITKCHKGHEFTPDNIYWTRGKRGCKRCCRDRDFKKRFGISVEQFESLVLSQNNKCSECGETFTETPVVNFDKVQLSVTYLRCYRCSRKDVHPYKYRTHCKRGHELTEDNVYPGKCGRRQCKICTKECKRINNLKHPNRSHGTVEQRKSWIERNPGYYKINGLKKLYGLSLEQYEGMITSQNNKCGICGSELVKPHVDHNHSTNKVRGILCSNCNLGIGLLQDSPEVLIAAAEYLHKHQES